MSKNQRLLNNLFCKKDIIRNMNNNDLSIYEKYDIINKIFNEVDVKNILISIINDSDNRDIIITRDNFGDLSFKLNNVLINNNYTINKLLKTINNIIISQGIIIDVNLIETFMYKQLISLKIFDRLNNNIKSIEKDGYCEYILDVDNEIPILISASIIEQKKIENINNNINRIWSRFDGISDNGITLTARNNAVSWIINACYAIKNDMYRGDSLRELIHNTMMLIDKYIEFIPNDMLKHVTKDYLCRLVVSAFTLMDTYFNDIPLEIRIFVDCVEKMRYDGTPKFSEKEILKIWMIMINNNMVRYTELKSDTITVEDFYILYGNNYMTPNNINSVRLNKNDLDDMITRTELEDSISRDRIMIHSKIGLN